MGAQILVEGAAIVQPREMPVAQRDLISKYYLARQGDGNGPRWRGPTNSKSVWQIMRAAMKRARVARAMTMVMRMAGDKEAEGDSNKCGGQQKGRMRQSDGN